MTEPLELWIAFSEDQSDLELALIHGSGQVLAIDEISWPSGISESFNAADLEDLGLELLDALHELGQKCFQTAVADLVRHLAPTPVLIRVDAGIDDAHFAVLASIPWEHVDLDEPWELENDEVNDSENEVLISSDGQTLILNVLRDLSVDEVMSTRENRKIPGLDQLPSLDFATSSDDAEAIVQDVWFATGRRMHMQSGNIFETPIRAPEQNRYGKCEVVIPKNHRSGELGNTVWERLVGCARWTVENPRHNLAPRWRRHHRSDQEVD